MPPPFPVDTHDVDRQAETSSPLGIRPAGHVDGGSGESWPDSAPESRDLTPCVACRDCSELRIHRRCVSNVVC